VLDIVLHASPNMIIKSWDMVFSSRIEAFGKQRHYKTTSSQLIYNGRQVRQSLEMVSKPQIAFKSKAQIDEKAEHIQ
jgi:hypothetical protein